MHSKRKNIHVEGVEFTLIYMLNIEYAFIYPVRLGLLQSTFRGELKETIGVCGAVGVCAPPLLLAGRTGEECLDEALLPTSLADALLLLRVRRRPNRDFEVSEAGGMPGCTFSSPSCKP